MTRLSLLAVICWAATGCGGNGRQEPEAPFDPQQALKDFGGISYRRTGGFAGTEDQITISPSGSVETTGRFLGKRQGQISEFQVMQLVRLLEGWEKLRDEYPAPAGSADAFEHEIEYRGKKVRASDANRQTPEQFTRLRDRLEALTRGLKVAE
jgi:hypothetical protein